MTEVVGAVIALVAVATGMAMLHDAVPVPANRTPEGWLSHLLRLGALVAITAGGGVLLVFPQLRTASGYELAFRGGLVAFMAMQAPCPWWKYVTRGRR